MNTPTYLYAILAEETNNIKFGISSDLTKRLYNIQCHSPVTVELRACCLFPSREEALAAENAIKHMLKPARKTGEWYYYCQAVYQVIDSMEEFHFFPDAGTWPDELERMQDWVREGSALMSFEHEEY